MNTFVLPYSIIFLTKCKMFFNSSYANGYFLHLQKTSENQMVSGDQWKRSVAWNEFSGEYPAGNYLFKANNIKYVQS